MLRAMHKPVATGMEALVGKMVDVLESSGHEEQVWVNGAIWQAISDDLLAKGDRGRIIGFEGLTLRVTQTPAFREAQDRKMLHHH